jgi:hypothetical protein
VYVVDTAVSTSTVDIPRDIPTTAVVGSLFCSRILSFFLEIPSITVAC